MSTFVRGLRVSTYDKPQIAATRSRPSVADATAELCSRIRHPGSHHGLWRRRGWFRGRHHSAATGRYDGLGITGHGSAARDWRIGESFGDVNAEYSHQCHHVVVVEYSHCHRFW